MKRIISLITLVLFIVIGQAQSQLSLEEFNSFCDDSGLQFTMPEGYKIQEVKDNPDLGYSFAVINADATMEIRYTIWPLEKMNLNNMKHHC